MCSFHMKLYLWYMLRDLKDFPLLCWPGNFPNTDSLRYHNGYCWKDTKIISIMAISHCILFNLNRLFTKSKQKFVSMKLLWKYCCGQDGLFNVSTSRSSLRLSNNVNTCLDIASFSSQKMHYINLRSLRSDKTRETAKTAFF